MVMGDGVPSPKEYFECVDVENAARERRICPDLILWFVQTEARSPRASPLLLEKHLRCVRTVDKARVVRGRLEMWFIATSRTTIYE